MKANELRIGNLVNRHKFEGDVVHVIDSKDIEIIENSDPKSILYVKNYSPITLTEEWFLKFGFEKDGRVLSKMFSKIDLQVSVNIVGDKYCIIYVSGAFGMIQPRHLKYLHEIQNLIHALTGEELTIKE
jgi:hypothetical protein